ncbi:MAG: DUF6174 domain-containing protein [Anaerolineales bacterium]
MSKAMKKFVLPLISVLLFLCLCQILFDPFAPSVNRHKLDKLQVELNRAKAKWESQNITSYSYAVQYSVPMLRDCGAQITVEKGEIVEVIETMHGVDKLPTPIALSKPQWSYEYCNYSEGLTISEAFDKIQKLIKANMSLNVTFNQQFGFIEQYYGSPNVQHGRLNGYITESEFSYTFSNFQRSDNATP